MIQDYSLLAHLTSIYLTVYSYYTQYIYLYPTSMYTYAIIYIR